MGMPSWRQVLGAVAEAWETQREEIRAQGERVAPRLAGGALLTASEQPLQSRLARRRRRDAAPGLRQRQRRLGRAAQVPAGVGHRVPAGARRAADGAADPALDGRRRHLRPGRRRLLALQRRRALDRPALREDALRQRAARARLPARLPGQPATRCCGAPPRRRSTGPCARCAPPRAASTARSTPTPRAWRASSTSGASTSCAPRWAMTPTPRSPGSAPPSAATSRARTSSSRAVPSRRPSSATGSARRCSTSAPSACALASTTSAWPPGTRS